MLDAFFYRSAVLDIYKAVSAFPDDDGVKQEFMISFVNGIYGVPPALYVFFYGCFSLFYWRLTQLHRHPKVVTTP
jgi:hypothetical protein